MTPETDQISEFGYLSGAERNTEVPEWLRSKYKKSVGQVKYEFGDGRVVDVSAQTARALEFSFIDSKNSSSPKDSVVVGIHENLEHILKVVSLSGMEIRINPSSYIRFDEISLNNLKLTSAEELYRKFGLSHPNYSPIGEWVSDTSIPKSNLINTFKFRDITARRPLSQNPILPNGENIQVGDAIFYQAMSGRRYIGVVSDDVIIDDYIPVSYFTRFGTKRIDSAHVSMIDELQYFGRENAEYKFATESLNSVLGQSPLSMPRIISELRKDPELNLAFQTDAGVAEGYTIEEHHGRVFDVYREFVDEFGIADLKTPGLDGIDRFMAKVISACVTRP